MSADTAGTAVSIPATNAVAAPVARPLNAIPGLERMAAKELIVADLVLGQGTSRTEGVTAGKFYNKLDPKEQWESLIVVPLTYGHGRVLFPRTPEGKPDYDAPIPCRSDDGLVPAPSIEKPIAQRCVADIRGDELCPMAKWGANRTKPKCAETATLVLIVEETGMPFRFSVKGADCTTLRKLLSNVAHKAIGSKTPLSLFDFRFKLGTIKETNSEGSWYAPTFTSLELVKEIGSFAHYHSTFAAAVVPPDISEAKSAQSDAAPSNDSATSSPAPVTDPPAEPSKKSPKGREKF